MDLDAIKKQIEGLKKSGRSKAKVKAIEKEVEKIEAASPVVTENVPVVEKVRDDLVLNCVPCKGEGITFPKHSPEGVICPVCQGTGKH